ncbi:MAG TPA: alpha/beta fold hydrolase [Opitutaceae bacterium]|jgi:medium-chain acyl-[acyl-carrier-protein] hydrolase|nr:alpha/beta fold hydrolase [Opitutaceae bacterium]
MNKWLIPFGGRFQEKARLICFPPAGGGWSLFSPWQNALGPDIRVVGVHLAERESRSQEPPAVRLTALIDALEKEISPLLDKPFAFLGHSFGALVAYELAHRLKANRHIEPSLLVVAARSAPHLQPDSRFGGLTDAELEALLRRLGGTPETLLQERQLMALMIPSLRADLQMNEAFEYTERTTLECPIAALGGLDDPLVARAKIEEWRSHTAGEFTMKDFPGGHFFLKEKPSPVLDHLAGKFSEHLLVRAVR